VGETQIYDLQSTLFSPIAESLLGESDVQDVITLQNEGKAAYYEFKLLALSKHHLDTESFLLSLRDVTAREHFQQILQFQASTDSLSELLNRRAFFERVGECTAHAPEDEQEIGRLPDAEEGQCYLLMLDIDHFKKINDTYGHAVGDMVIKEIGAILKRCFNSADVIGRIGGEEFAIFYRDLSHEQLMILIAHFMEALKAIRSEHLPAISASIGIAETDGRIPVEVLMKEADKALYNAKETGRNKAVFYNAL
jgi:diguanylate cyclase (GGDEF)-like protein